MKFWHNVYGVIHCLNIKDKSFVFVNWIKDGILYVKEIFDENGEMYYISYSLFYEYIDEEK